MPLVERTAAARRSRWNLGAGPQPGTRVWQVGGMCMRGWCVQRALERSRLRSGLPAGSAWKCCVLLLLRSSSSTMWVGADPSAGSSSDWSTCSQMPHVPAAPAATAFAPLTTPFSSIQAGAHTQSAKRSLTRSLSLPPREQRLRYGQARFPGRLPAPSPPRSSEEPPHIPGRKRALGPLASPASALLLQNTRTAAAHPWPSRPSSP